MFAVHAHHALYHLQLPLGIEQGEQLMHIPVGIPQREDRIAASRRRQNLVALHGWVLSVDVAQHVGMNQQVIEGRVEHRLLLLRATLYLDTSQVADPGCTGISQHLIKVLFTLFFLQVETGIGHADKRYAQLHLYLLALSQLVVEVEADVIASHLLLVVGIALVLAAVSIPLSLHTHGALLLPVTCRGRQLVDAHHEVDREDGLRVVAEGAEQLASLPLAGARLADKGTTLVSQSLTQIEENMPLAFGKGKATHPTTHRGSHLGTDAIARQVIGEIARRGLLLFITATVLLVIHRQFAGGRHQQQRTQLRTAHSTQVDMSIAGKIAVVILVGRGPPAGILVILVVRRAHHIEGHHRHHTTRANCSGVTGSVVGGTNKWVHVVQQFAVRHSARHGRNEQQDKKKSFHLG